jgi:hypothetical protein
LKQNSEKEEEKEEAHIKRLKKGMIERECVWVGGWVGGWVGLYQKNDKC